MCLVLKVAAKPTDEDVLRPKQSPHAQIFVGDESGDNERSVAFSKGEKVAAKPTDEDALRPKQSPLRSNLRLR